ncbi:MAG: ABC transporter ATP-binding protein [Gammaproteobacteria bacterium]|nr:MAG: ABC transporter ATP-binding protein [Gammaproteobacteria bacterium]
MTAAVSVTDIKKYYRQVHALDGVSLTIDQGEFFGLLGPNGAGKSTLINIMAGLTLADSGHLSVMGHDVVRDYRQSRRAIGVVPQEVVFDPFFTVREVLRLQAGYFGLGKRNDDWIDEILHTLKLVDKADANMRTLSGGMKRRMLIAQALVHKPRVVVLDEPTAGVDVELRQLLWEFIRKLHKEGHTILLTTHYLEEAEMLCDRIAILNKGKIVALDDKRKLLDSDIGRMRRLYLQTSEPIVNLPESLADKVVSQEEQQIILQFDKSIDSIGTILEALQQANIKVIDLHTKEADLEDVFVDLMRQQDS